MQRILSLLLPFLGLVLALLPHSVMAQNKNEALRKLQMAEFAIAHLYVDTVNEQRLVEEAIIRMLSQLDPHSSYSNPEETRELNEPLQGNFEGIGVQFQLIEDTLLVIQPVSGGPSERVGILAGDRITAVDDTLIAGVKMSTDEIMRRLRGPKGSRVELTVVRRGLSESLRFPVVRDKIPIHSLDAAHLLAPGIGYIRISRFAQSTPDEFSAALKELKAQGLRDLVLDLQGNGGGYLNAAIELANQFLPQRALLVYTMGRASRRHDFLARGGGAFQEGRLVVLVDEFSASASEILSGAIQDHDRGVIIGRRTFGKGLVQRPIDLPDGSMIRLTVSRYYTPAGRCIQKPYDNRAPGDEMLNRYHSDLVIRLNRGELIHADSIRFADSLKVQTLRLGRTVYGGGGIMPDYFVPLDTARYTTYHRRCAAQGIFNQTVAAYIEHHRAELQRRYKQFADFSRKFQVGEELLADFRQRADKAGIAFDSVEYQRSEPLMTLQLKALLARDLWDMNEYYAVINASNASVQQALKILTDGFYEQLLEKQGNVLAP